MFYDNFVKLCKEKDVSRTKACADCGLSRTAWHKWESGGVPNGSTLNKFAEYFGKNIDVLIGNTENKNPATETGSGIPKDDIDLLKQFHEAHETTKAAIRLSLQRAPCACHCEAPEGPHPRVASLAASRQFTFWQSVPLCRSATIFSRSSGTWIAARNARSSYVRASGSTTVLFKNCFSDAMMRPPS